MISVIQYLELNRTDERFYTDKILLKCSLTNNYITRFGEALDWMSKTFTKAVCLEV